MKNNEAPALFPMFVDLSAKKIIVVGAGRIASRRIKVLLSFTENIVVIAKEIHPDIIEAVKGTQVQLLEQPYAREIIYSADIVIAATDDEAVNNDIHSVCKCLGIFVNVISDRRKCDFHFPGIVKKENLVIGINAGGVDHKLVKTVRQNIEEALEK